MLWAEETRTERLLKGLLLLPVYETNIYNDCSIFFSLLMDLDGSVGMLFALLR